MLNTFSPDHELLTRSLNSPGDSVNLPIFYYGEHGWADTTHSDTAINGRTSQESAVLGRAVVALTDQLPNKTNEDAAQSSYLKGRILNAVVPGITSGEVITPQALGYTYIPGQGFAQVLERVDCHSPRLDDEGLESQRVREARQLLWSKAEETGIQPLTHIHPQNPLGKSNFRVHSDGRLIWLDGRSDIPLAGAVGRLILPHFGFYQDADEKFGKDGRNSAFSEIDAEKIAELIDQFNLDPQEKAQLSELLNMYQSLQDVLSEPSGKKHRELVADDLENLGASKNRLRIIRSSVLGHKAVRAFTIGGSAATYTGDKIQSTALSLKDKPNSYYLYLTNPTIRTHAILKYTVLRGLKAGCEHGSVTEKEYKEALDVVSPHDLSTYVGLQTFYLANSRVFDLITGSLIATNPGFKEFLTIFTAGTVGSSAVRGVATAITSLFRDTELKKATMSSMIPMLGGYTAIVQQMMATYGEYTKDIKHNTFRLLASNISKLRLGGGWGSDAEEKLWQKNQNYKTVYQGVKKDTQAIISHTIAMLNKVKSKF